MPATCNQMGEIARVVFSEVHKSTPEATPGPKEALQAKPAAEKEARRSYLIKLVPRILPGAIP